MASTKSMDLTNGSVLKKLLLFTFPIWATAFLQQLYHSADIMVVGNFAQNSQVSLAAVGSTTNITSLFVNLFSGLSIGSNVIAAHAIGQRDYDKVRRVIVSAISLGFYGGLFLAVFGYIFAPVFLRMMGVPEDVLGEAVTYMRIIFLGQPASLVFNFCSGIFRAHGNSKRSLHILTFTGLVNVILNLFFVLVFHLDSAGVALATVFANVISAAIALSIIFHPQGEFQIAFREIRLHKAETFSVVKIGLPAGLNAILFNISSVIVATAANALGKTVVASVSAANSVTHVFNTLGSSFGTATVSFAGQNYGAGKMKRVDELLRTSLLTAQALLLVGNISLTLFPEFFLGLFTSDPEVIELGRTKLLLTGWGYMAYNLAEIFTAGKRGFGKSMTPTVLNVACVCFLRIAWVLGVYPFLEHNTLNLYICIPLSWGASGIAQAIDYYFVRRRVWRKLAQEEKLCPEDMQWYLKKQEKAEKRA